MPGMNGWGVLESYTPFRGERKKKQETIAEAAAQLT
jgi:hypothetical protein